MIFVKRKTNDFTKKPHSYLEKKKKKVRRVMCGTKKNIDSLNLSPPFKKKYYILCKKTNKPRFSFIKNYYFVCVFFVKLKLIFFPPPIDVALFREISIPRKKQSRL